MKHHMKRVALSAAVAGLAAVLLTGAVSGQSNPQVGLWKGDLAKSSVSPGTAVTSTTSNVEASGAGITVTVDAATPDGPSHWSFTANYDGQDNVIVGTSPYGTSVALTRVDANTTGSVYKRDGAVTTTSTTVVGPDGKTRTVTIKGTDPQGRPFNDVYVYDRQ